jgi:branched-chain amino acid aminotransferase
MITIRYSADRGWHEATVEPLAPIPLHPATAALHYAQEIFEGLKDYRRNDDTIVLLRPDDNADRFNRSAARMAMPELPEETLCRPLRRW